MNEQQATAFLSDLLTVCREHNVTLESCGCCDSIGGQPWDMKAWQPAVYRNLKVIPEKVSMEVQVDGEWKEIQVWTLVIDRPRHTITATKPPRRE